MFVGRLVLGPRALRLDGRRRGATGRRWSGVRLRGAPGPADRQPGRRPARGPSVARRRARRRVVSRRERGPGAPIVQELVERLSGLRLWAARKATVVVPLREGAFEAGPGAASAHGPRFDPGETAFAPATSSLLTPDEAVFIFEAENEKGSRLLLGQVELWAAAAVWGVAGRGAPATGRRAPIPGNGRASAIVMAPRVVIAGGGVAALEAALALRALAEEQRRDRARGRRSRTSGTGRSRLPSRSSWAEPDATSWKRSRQPRARPSRSARSRASTPRPRGDDVGRRRSRTTSCSSRSAPSPTTGGPGRADVPRPGRHRARSAPCSSEIAAGDVRRVAFAVPWGAVWSLPLYELALDDRGTPRPRVRSKASS